MVMVDRASNPSFLILFFSLTLRLSLASQTLPPLPLPPLPSASQLPWQLGEIALFLHFGTNTFNDCEWGTGRADPSVFAPTALDARQWARVAAEAGFARAVLTAKHHDGFCLWPSDYTDYSVKSSPWRGGRGDVVAELADAAKEFGIGLGLYLSPWDRHDSSYGDTVKYNEYYLAQMTELLTRYGEIKEVWLDGAKGEDEKDMDYLFNCWFRVIHQLQPGAVIFSDAGPDSRWIGDENGVAGSTCWSLLNQSAVKIGGENAPYVTEGDQFGHDWIPGECDVSIRPGWFWHKTERPKSAISLLDIYYKSVGRNCLLILNVPPNSSGLLSSEDVEVLHEFAELRRIIFSQNLAQDAIVTASSMRGGIYSYWAPDDYQADWIIFLDLGQPITFNVFQVQEPIQMGQRVIEFHVDLLEDGEWNTIVKATTIGYKRLLQFPVVKAQFLRLLVDKSRADPLISYFGVYLDPYSIIPDALGSSQRASFNDSQVISLEKYNESVNSSIAVI
ncbi:putative alpha-L-fucosidase [Dioscorea sansibarensis]